ncbi:VOC family protein [Exiguobacterium antarcticum]|uniref:VOC family protein n=1 Tax=Exiguobacterium antarcticum TaxID=132920 RepID=A0ABT6R2Z9_9BACL|nr:VOC family protein [Exiguobacterium antarcticum]MDI3235152.1 VOC family protein [Exiguobacterium antarcticum]
MKITAATLWTNDVKPMQDFYTETLGFPLFEETATAFTVQIGTSQLRFELDTTRHSNRNNITLRLTSREMRFNWQRTGCNNVSRY